jgi:hypothetical protein
VTNPDDGAVYVNTWGTPDWLPPGWWDGTSPSAGPAARTACSKNTHLKSYSILAGTLFEERKCIVVVLYFREVDRTSVADPEPYVFGSPGSGSSSISTRYGSGSGSFYNQAKIVWKTLIPTVLWLLYDFLSLKSYVNVASERNKQKTYGSGYGLRNTDISQIDMILTLKSVIVALPIDNGPQSSLDGIQPGS